MFKKYYLRLPALLLSLALCCSFFAVPAFAGGETAITTEEESVFPFTIADAIKILKHCTGMITLTPEETEKLDVDFDSAITLRDAIIILKVIAEGVSEYASKIQYIRIGAFPHKESPEVVVIKSKTELNDNNRNKNEKFKEAMQKYEENYFDDNVLVLVFLMEESGSIRHKVSDIAFGSEEIDITIDPFFKSEILTLDEAGWQVMLEMKKSEYTNKEIKVNISEDKTVDRMEYILNLWKYGKTWAY